MAGNITWRVKEEDNHPEVCSAQTELLYGSHVVLAGYQWEVHIIQIREVPKYTYSVYEWEAPSTQTQEPEMEDCVLMYVKKAAKIRERYCRFVILQNDQLCNCEN